eukprot:jgi/Undpi1/9678/HiC_scaffold_27.g12134.m1
MPDLLDKVSALEALQAGMNELKEVKQRYAIVDRELPILARRAGGEHDALRSPPYLPYHVHIFG